MSKFSDAVETLRRMAVQYQGIVEAANTLEAMGSAGGALDATLALLEKRKAELASTEAQLAESKKQVESVLAKTRASAKEITDQAAEDAKNVRLEAQVKAAAYAQELTRKTDETIKKSLAEANALKARADEQAANARAVVASLTEKQIALSAEVATVTTSVQALKAEEASIKERLRKIVGN